MQSHLFQALISDMTELGALALFVGMIMLVARAAAGV